MDFSILWKQSILAFLVCSMTVGAFAWRVFVDNHVFIADHPGPHMTFGARYIGVAPSER